jgi:hypothetical protein
MTHSIPPSSKPLTARIRSRLIITDDWQNSFRTDGKCLAGHIVFSNQATVSEIKRILEENLTRSGIGNSRR